MKLTFIGDVMLGRMVGSKYDREKYRIVSPEIIDIAKKADLVIANLESPLSINSKTEGDHLQFAGKPELLKEFNFVDLFSTANNHITDCGELGIDETVEVLTNNGFQHNGVYKEEYKPFIIQSTSEKLALVTLTDMLNIPFDVDSQWHVLRMGDEKVKENIKALKKSGFTVVVFAHVGMLFTRFPNPITHNYLHDCVDWGADLVVTSHSHCLGGMEEYNGKLIFHSIGDFCMDGNSKRRRRAGILNLEIEGGNVKKWEMIPTEMTQGLEVTIPSRRLKAKMLKSFDYVSNNIMKHKTGYEKFFRKVYRKEIMIHSFSTLSFILHERGISGLTKMISVRASEVLRTMCWMLSDRSKVQRDDDAIKANRKKISQEDLFGK